MVRSAKIKSRNCFVGAGHSKFSLLSCRQEDSRLQQIETGVTRAMIHLRNSWNPLRIQQKVWGILLLVFLPLIVALAGHVTLLDRLQSLQQQHHQVVLAREQVHILSRLTVDIEDAFRGYLLTRQDVFLTPMKDAEPKLKPTLDRIVSLAAGVPGLDVNIQVIEGRVNRLLRSKHELLDQVQAGHLEEVLQYVQSGQGIALSDDLREHFRILEDRLVGQMEGMETNQLWLARLAFWGLVFAVVGAIGLGLIGARLLARSITSPIETLQHSVKTFGTQADSDEALHAIAVRTADEIGRLAYSYLEMIERIRQQIRELEALSTIGHEINAIGPDGLDGVLSRITDHAADLLQADICLVMLRNEQMGCWIVEAASGSWNDQLQKSVMLWEEFPISVQAFETKQPAIGEDLRRDSRPEVSRRNLIGDSMLAIPLLTQGKAFGVLALLQERAVPREAWNLRLAKGFADEAAVAIANARLYQAAQQKGQDVQARIRELEYLAEALAHDLKAPGERVEGLAALVRADSASHLSEQAQQWVSLIETNGKELRRRVEHILQVARIGVRATAVEAVDPAVVLQDVLKLRAGELERRQVRVEVQPALPLVACHGAYLRQVFDNIISNAIKFTGGCAEPRIRITWERKGEQVSFKVSDNGRGIAPSDQARVFEPFVRLHADSIPGSGIGLTIVKRIVELYGGRVWIESNPSGGCSVCFTIPVLGELRHAARAVTSDNVAPPQWTYGSI